MKTIFKYPLQGLTSESVGMRRGAQILDVQNQRGQLCVWVIVDTDAPVILRQIVIHGTGAASPEIGKGKYIATVQVGSYVWHVFDLGEREP